ncbi:Clp protease N-terminal domain-containing protein [Sphaerisporangium sp. NPDC005289]|uniref:Clp protease N-terminal domain-containing protein n=1 Tax=Sphaerisporangium sp. NPDC005289 TaxID=3155247 RepID=UPI0033AADA47
MFERFHADARKAVAHAQHEATVLRHDTIRPEHVLLGLLAQTDSVTARVLARHGLDHDTAGDAVARVLGANTGDSTDDIDADALESIGIDLDAIRQKVEAAFGPGALDRDPRRSSRSLGGHIPFGPRAKKVLELSLREAIHLGHNYIGDGHILLGLLREGDGLVTRVIADAGIDFTALRQEIRAELN